MAKCCHQQKRIESKVASDNGTLCSMLQIRGRHACVRKHQSIDGMSCVAKTSFILPALNYGSDSLLQE